MRTSLLLLSLLTFVVSPTLWGQSTKEYINRVKSAKEFNSMIEKLTPKQKEIKIYQDPANPNLVYFADDAKVIIEKSLLIDLSKYTIITNVDEYFRRDHKALGEHQNRRREVEQRKNSSNKIFKNGIPRKIKFSVSKEK